MPLSKQGALHLASPTKTVPQWEGITPRWLLNLIPWVEVKAGIYRINHVAEPPTIVSEHPEGAQLPDGSSGYENGRSVKAEPGNCDPSDPVPRVVHLSTVQTVVKVHSRIQDLYSQPYDQRNEQIRIGVAAIKEEKERCAINSPVFGLQAAAAPQMRISATGAPTPDDLDNLLARVWKLPAFFLAHPRAIAAFGQQCSARGVTPETVEMFGAPFMSWRGVPLVPSDKLATSGESKDTTTSILLMRVGEAEQGVVGLHQAGVGDEKLQSLQVREMYTDNDGVTAYLLTCYFGIAVLSDDALGVLEDVSI